MDTSADVAPCKDLTDAFGALSHQIRLTIVEDLSRGELGHEPPGEDPLIPDDPRWVGFGELGTEFDHGQSSISCHARALAQARLLDRVEQGRSTYLQIRIERLEEIADMLTGTLELESAGS